MHKSDYAMALHMNHWDYVKPSIKTFGTNRSLSNQFYCDHSTILKMDRLRIPRRRELNDRVVNSIYTKDHSSQTLTDLWERYAEGADVPLHFQGFVERRNSLAARYLFEDETVDIDAVKLKTIAVSTKGPSPIHDLRTKSPQRTESGELVLSAVMLGNKNGIVMPLRPEKS